MVDASDKQMIKEFDEIDSTNVWLRSCVNDYAHGFCVTANFQSAGKGQATNKWESERDKNLLFSLLLEPTKIPLQQQFLLSELVAVAMVDVLEQNLHCEVRIKWPNDIYVENSKLAGILIETFVAQGVMAKAIIGVGLNVNQTRFVSDAPNPISMQQIAKCEFSRSTILNDVIDAILQSYAKFSIEKADELQQLYFSKLYRNSGYYTFGLPCGDKFEAKIEKVEPTGHLVLLKKNGEKCSFAFKEVQFII